MHMILAQTTVTSPDPLTILNNVQTFYNDAWVRLLWVMGAGLTLMTVVLGFLVPLIQARSARAEAETLRAGLKAEGEAIGAKLHAEMEEQLGQVREMLDTRVKENNEQLKSQLEAILKDEIKSAKESLNRSVCDSTGKAYQLQARIIGESNDPVGALRSLVHACHAYLNANNFTGLGRCLEGINNICLPKVNKEQLEEDNIRTQLKEMLAEVKHADSGGHYADRLQDIEKGLKAAEARKV